MKNDKNEISINLTGFFRFGTNEDGFITGVSVDGIDITTILRRLDGQRARVSLQNNLEEKLR